MSESILGNDRPLSEIIGATHSAGKYHLTDKDYLNEGADVLLEMGSKVLKVLYTGFPQRYYHYNHNWPKINSLIDLAETRYFQDVFAKPFTTYMLTAFAPGPPDRPVLPELINQGGPSAIGEYDYHYFTAGMTPDDIEWERNSFYEFSKYLLTKYKGTGKTFILQNWESDWSIIKPHLMNEPDPVAVDGLTDWLNARQAGVDKAREEVGMDGVIVAHAPEVNLVSIRSMEGKTTVINSVIPNTRCDMYSFSAWDSINGGTEKLRPALEYIAERAPASKLFGRDNVYIGEFGIAENLTSSEMQLKSSREVVETGLDFGSPYVVFWDVYCDGPAREYEPTTTNADCWGNWLVRPDGTKPPVYDYFKDLCSE
ncbi:MAG: hypothetical protein ACYC27_10765 [Armatimonadota bacterium]